MSTRNEISLPTRPVLSHAADAVRANGLLFVAGVLPVDAGGVLVGGDLAAQARHVLTELGEGLAAGGCSGSDVAAVNVYLTAIDDRSLIEQPWRQVFCGVRPAGTIVQVRALAVPGAMIELDAVAVVP